MKDASFSVFAFLDYLVEKLFRVLRKFSHSSPALPITALFLGYHCQIFKNFLEIFCVCVEIWSKVSEN